jgi:hypothetical protein
VNVTEFIHLYSEELSADELLARKNRTIGSPLGKRQD